MMTGIPPAIRSMSSGVFGRLRGYGTTRAASTPASVPTSIGITPASASFALGKTQQFTAVVRDQFGADMGLAVTWSSNSANVTINSSSGVATGAAYGSATITATYQSLTSTASATTQQPTALAIVTQPGGATTGSAFTTQPTIELRDGSGNPDAESGRTVTASIASGSGTLSGTTSVVTDASGRAVFTDLVISATAPPSDFTIAFACTGLTGVTSATLTVASASSAWLANKPTGWQVLASLDFATATIPTSEPGNLGVISGSDWMTNGVVGSPWAKLSDCWRVTKVAGVYGDANNGYGWGHFYLNMAGLPGTFHQEYYIACELMWEGASAAQDYEWHDSTTSPFAASNKWFEDDWPGTPYSQLLVQSEENGVPLNFENLGHDYHPGTTVGRPRISSNVKHVWEMRINRTTHQFRQWLDGTLYTDNTNANGADGPGSGWHEIYFRNFDGGGGMTRTRTSYIRYYRIIVYRP